MKTIVQLFILTFLSLNVFSQSLNLKILIGSSESDVKQSISGYANIKEDYTENGKSIAYYFTDYVIIYDFKADKICKKVFVIFKTNEAASKINQWFYENGYTAKTDVRSGQTDQWEKTIIIKSTQKGIPDNEIPVRALKVDDKSYFFADFVSTLLGG